MYRCAQARQLTEAQDELERRDAEVAAQGMVVTALAQERDAARGAAIEVGLCRLNSVKNQFTHSLLSPGFNP